jgi:hypothetical protein
MHRYRPVLDYPALVDLYASWGAAAHAPPQTSLPLTGLIEPGLGAMFLYKTDSDICSLEHAIVQRGHPERAAAVHAMVDALTEEAHRCGFRKIYVYVGNEAAVKRAIATGFQLDNEPQRWQLSREVA